MLFLQNSCRKSQKGANDIIMKRQIVNMFLNGE